MRGLVSFEVNILVFKDYVDISLSYKRYNDFNLVTEIYRVTSI